ncbi:MAG: hypothetical protein JRN20_12915 [Nitrososphaerota archaeon]|nr:hypothetical protein [Nitrososphaerota archaeon]
MPKHKERLVRTTITLPASLKEKMDQTETNWSEEIREMISQRVEEEGKGDMAEAVILNERVKRQASKDWNALTVIKQWRKRKSM